MEYLAPPLNLAFEVIGSLENGDSVSTGISRYIERNQESFVVFMQRWLIAVQQGRDPTQLLSEVKSEFRLVICELLWRGIQGEPILPLLHNFTEEVKSAQMLELDEYIKKLPFVSLLPIFFLQLPAFLILLFGPLLSELTQGVLR